MGFVVLSVCFCWDGCWHCYNIAKRQQEWLSRQRTAGNVESSSHENTLPLNCCIVYVAFYGECRGNRHDDPDLYFSRSNKYCFSTVFNGFQSRPRLSSGKQNRAGSCFCSTTHSFWCVVANCCKDLSNYRINCLDKGTTGSASASLSW